MKVFIFQSASGTGGDDAEAFDIAEFSRQRVGSTDADISLRNIISFERQNDNRRSLKCFVDWTNNRFKTVIKAVFDG